MNIEVREAHRRWAGKPLARVAPSLIAWRLGEIARVAGAPHRNDVGDPIDRGLILLRLLDEGGYLVMVKPEGN